MSTAGISLPRAASPLHDVPTFRRLDLVDPYLLIATLLLMAYGLVITYSTSFEDVAAGDPAQFIVRGAIFTALGIVTMVAVDAFSQAFTNPLMSQNVFNKNTFSPLGWQTIHETADLRRILERNSSGSSLGRVAMTRHDWRPI